MYAITRIAVEHIGTKVPIRNYVSVSFQRVLHSFELTYEIWIINCSIRFQFQLVLE